jgi:hypothetical protein
MRRLLIAVALLLALSPAKAYEDVSFLEAGTFFLTGLEPGPSDEVGNNAIAFHDYPVVAYIAAEANACAIRLRSVPPRPIWVWQFDFCKVIRWQQGAPPAQSVVYFMGYKTAFCIYKRWDRNENYDGPINDENSACGVLGGAALNDAYIVYTSTLDIHYLLADKYQNFSNRRSVQRMLDALKYITSMRAVKPY